jgi:hypothetical protein
MKEEEEEEEEEEERMMIKKKEEEEEKEEEKKKKKKEEEEKKKKENIIRYDVLNWSLNIKTLTFTLFTPSSRVLLEKLTVNYAASQEIPRIYGTRKSLTVPTSARHLYLS